MSDSRADPSPPASAPDSDLSASQHAAIDGLLRISPLADELGALFAHAGHELALVGGSVRDALLGHPGYDLDFATSARPDEVVRIAGAWADSKWETGIGFGTVGLQKNGVRLEVTTYRFEVYDDLTRKPVVTFGDSLRDDLERRDFTINAMAVSVPDHVFHDPFHGLADLARGILRTPGLPEDSFADDPLRMLRGARFAARLAFTVDPGVIAAMTAMADRISKVSAERVRDELSKLLLAASPRAGLTLLVDTGLADRVLPELPKLRLETDEHFRHKDVYEHSLTVLEQAIDLEDDGPDLVLRLAALLHDIGKPATRRKEPGGRVSFHHHEVVG